MSTKPKYYIVESSALPEVFLKVAEAKRLLSTGEASTVNEATRMTDISRSAFYKYRDAVLPFQSMMTGRIITFQLLLHDEQGLLSEILGVFADAGANISTINSIVPTNGTAVVTISAETIDLTITLEELMNRQTRDKVEDSSKVGYLGIKAADLTTEAIQMYNMPAGAFLTQVTEGGAADNAGIKKGDIIVKLDGQKVSGKDDLVSKLQYYESGETIEVVIARAESGEYKEQTVEVTLGSKPSSDN